MARLKASLVPVPTIQAPSATVPAVEPITYDLVIGVRRLKKGSFAGLWELVKLDQKMNRVKVLTDANSKGSVIRMIGNEVLKVI